MDAEIISLNKWKADHPPLLVAWQSASKAGIRCWVSWSRLWFPWL